MRFHQILHVAQTQTKPFHIVVVTRWDAVKFIKHFPAMFGTDANAIIPYGYLIGPQIKNEFYWRSGRKQFL